MTAEISTYALNTIAGLIYVEVLSPSTIDMITLPFAFDDEFDQDPRCLAPNPVNGNRWEVGAIITEERLGKVSIAFANESTVDIDHWNVKPFVLMHGFAKMIDLSATLEPQLIEAILSLHPRFFEGMGVSPSINQVVKKAIDPYDGFSYPDTITIAEYVLSSDLMKELRIVALSSVYEDLLKFLLPEQLESEVFRIKTLINDETILFKEEYMGFLVENETNPQTLMVYKTVSTLDFERRDNENNLKSPMYNQGETLLHGEKITNIFYDNSVGWVYCTDQIKGTILPVVIGKAPRLQNSVYRWWGAFTAGDIVAHYRDVDQFPTRRLRYGVVNHVMDETGMISVSWLLRDMMVPQHLYQKVTLGPDSNAEQGLSFDMATAREILDFYELGTKGVWRLQNVGSVNLVLYKGPFTAIVSPLTRELTKLGPRNEKDDPFGRNFEVLLQTHPEFISGRFVVLGSRYNEDFHSLEYACKPTGFPDDNRGIVWLPEGAISSTRTWFAEAGRHDPLPIALLHPHPLLHLSSDFEIATLGQWSAPRSELKIVPQKNTDPAVIGAGIVALYIMLDDS